MNHVQSPAAALAGLAAMLLLAAAAPEAQATDAGHKPRSQQAPHGTKPHSSEVQRTATRQTTVTRDPQARTRSVQSTTTGVNGRTTQYSSVAQRTDDGYTRDVSRTSPNGQLNERSIDVFCDATAQSCTRTVVGGRGD
jgi:hypothetical protein